MPDNEIVINKLNVADKSVIKYMESISKSKGIEKGLFDFYKTMDTIKSGTVILLATKGDKRVGILIAKRMSEDKTKYINIKVIDAIKSDSDVTDALVSKIVEIQKAGKEVGIKTENFSNQAAYIGKALTKAGFKKSANTYGTMISSVKGKAPTEAITGKRFNFGIKMRYYKQMLKLLTKHDIVINKSMNKTEGKSHHPIDLIGNKDHARRMSYFMKDLAANPSWYCFLLFKKDEKEPIGFIKSQTYKTGNLCFVTLYIEDKEFSKTHQAAFGILKEELAKTNEKFLGSTVNDNDSDENTAIKTALGPPLGHRYYKS